MPRTRAIAEIKLYGERNTGTRFLIRIIKENFAAPLLGSSAGRRHFEPHPLPADVNAHGWLIGRLVSERHSSLANRATVEEGFGWKHMSPPIDVIRVQQRRARATLFIVIVKHPVFWAVSFKNRPYHSYFQYDDMEFPAFLRHLFVPTDRDNVSAAAFGSVIDLYAAKVDGYRALADLGVPFELVRYEELLLDVPGFIKRLEEKYSLERASEQDIIQHESTKLKDDATLDDYREKYRLENVRTVVSPDDYDFILSAFGPERLRWLGYPETESVANPVLIEFTRGPLVESVHRGAVAVADARGEIVFSLGDIETPVYPRSSLKPIQALPLVESGAADAFNVNDDEVVLACASHSSEPMHTDRVAAWLERIGCTVDDLACGPHAIRHEPTAAAMAARGEKPTALHNNCSGKHTGFLTLAKRLGVSTAGYETHDHPVQRAVAASLRELTGLRSELPFGVDGCAAPNFAIPVAAMARALALFADPRHLAPLRASAIKRIVAAMIAHPDLVAGTGRSDTVMMREAQGRAATKAGAEGYYAAILPYDGLGIALKIDDGAGRAAEAAMAALLMRYGAVGTGGETERLARGPVTNTRGAEVGEKRPVAELVG